MKRDNVNYLLVGSAVLAALVLLLVTLFAITGRSGDATSYHVRFDNVSGLNFGAPVYYEGFRIGQVGTIAPIRDADGTRYRVELEVRADWAIPVDSIAQRQASGLLADMAIGIREGRSREFVVPGGELAGMDGGDVFAAMNNLAAELTVLTREQLQPLIATLSTRLDSIAGTLDDSLPRLVAEAQSLLTRLNQAAGGLEAITSAPNREAIASTLQHVQAVAADLQSTKARTDQLLASMTDAVGENRPALRRSMLDLERTIGTIAERIDSITHHLESSSRNLDEFSREIRRSPNRLLFTPPADEVQP